MQNNKYIKNYVIKNYKKLKIMTKNYDKNKQSSHLNPNLGVCGQVSLPPVGFILINQKQ